MILVELRLFGAFRKCSENSFIPITISSNCNVKELRKYIEAELNRLNPNLGLSKLIYESAIANENEVLDENAEISSSCKLAILPPVCGG